MTRCVPTVPRADRLYNYGAWRRACAWIAQPGNIPADARFLTPAMSQSFKWYTGRSEVANWKEIPQDSESIVRWWERMNEIYYTGEDQPGRRWENALAKLGTSKVMRLCEKYDAQYVITFRWPWPLALPVVYQNETYVVYRAEDWEFRAED